jgi:hypothetical protein
VVFLVVTIVTFCYFLWSVLFWFEYYLLLQFKLIIINI